MSDRQGLSLAMRTIAFLQNTKDDKNQKGGDRISLEHISTNFIFNLLCSALGLTMYSKLMA
jgi:hypothetical protein